MASKKVLVASVLLLATPTAALQSNEALALLQHRIEVGESSKSATVGLGNTVSTTEKGYQAVAGLRSDADMKAFIRRVLDKEARVVTDEAELTGLVPFYSGSQAVQNLDSLKQELRSVPWVGFGAGRFAPLSEEGYKQVAILKSKANMMAFARRILDANFMKSTDEGALNGMVPYFSGEVSVQSFDQLKKELLSSPFAVTRDNEEALIGGAHPISLAENKFWPFTGSDETKSDDKEKKDAEKEDKAEGKKVNKTRGNATKQDKNTTKGTTHGKEQALLEETKFWPFTSSEETETDSNKTEKEEKAEDKKVNKTKGNATKQDKNTTKGTTHGKEQALLEETKFWPFTSSEETESDSKKN